MIKLGDNSIGRVYLGNNEIGKAYLGSNLIFQKDSTPTPVFHSRLVFDGTAVIQTDLFIPSDGSIRFASLGNETEKKAQSVFSSLDDENKIIIGMGLHSTTTTTTRYFNVHYGSATANSTNRTLAFSYLTYSFFMTPYGFGIGDAFHSYTSGSSTPTKGLSFGSGSFQQKYLGTMGAVLVYGADAKNCQAYSDFNSYTSVYYLRPCTYLGKAGFWEVKTGRFFGNTAGAGQLTVAD